MSGDSSLSSGSSSCNSSGMRSESSPLLGLAAAASKSRPRLLRSGGPLVAPIRSKLYERYGDTRCQVAVCSVQGYRSNMEDEHCVAMRLERHPGYKMFGVFDGHNGDHAARFLAKQLFVSIDEQCEDLRDSAVLIDCILALDEKYCRSGVSESGSTIVMALLREETGECDVYWCGDSRAMTIGADAELRELTQDHKPTDPLEQERIERAGGEIRRHRVVCFVAWCVRGCDCCEWLWLM